MENKALITKVFKAMTPITSVIETRINAMDRTLQGLSPDNKEEYLISILKKTIELNEAIIKMAKKLKPHGSKRRSTLKGGMHRGHQLVRHQPQQQLAHRYNQHQARHAVNTGSRRNTRRVRKERKFNQWAAKPLFVLGGGIAFGLIFYKLILPLVLKKTPGSLARVSGKLGELVAIQIADGISWTSAATASVIRPLTTFFDLSSQEVQFYQPVLSDGHGNPYPVYPPVSGPVQGWSEGPDYEMYPSSTRWFGNPSVTLDPSSQLARINPTLYAQPTVELPHIRYLANSVRNMDIPARFGRLVEGILESGIDEETRNICFLLSILGGIGFSVCIFILLDKHRASMNVQILNAEEREARLDENSSRTRQLELNQARLERQLEAYQQLLGAPGNPAGPLLQGIAAGVQLANAGNAAQPAQPRALLGNAPRDQAPGIQEFLNENINVD